MIEEQEDEGGNTLLYSGWIIEQDHGDSPDVIFLKDSEGPFYDYIDGVYVGDQTYILAEQIRKDIDRYGEYLSVRYTVSMIRDTFDNALEGFIHQLCGKGEALFQAYYSETTGYLWTDENLQVGGHDLLEEIRSWKGVYLNLEITYHRNPDDD